MLIRVEVTLGQHYGEGRPPKFIYQTFCRFPFPFPRLAVIHCYMKVVVAYTVEIALLTRPCLIPSMCGASQDGRADVSG